MKELTIKEKLAPFMGSVSIHPSSGCWLWIAATTPKGYGQVWTHGTHCPQGHEYSLGNIYMHLGARHCRECMRLRDNGLLFKQGKSPISTEAER